MGGKCFTAQQQHADLKQQQQQQQHLPSVTPAAIATNTKEWGLELPRPPLLLLPLGCTGGTTVGLAACAAVRGSPRIMASTSTAAATADSFMAADVILQQGQIFNCQVIKGTFRRRQDGDGGGSHSSGGPLLQCPCHPH